MKALQIYVFSNPLFRPCAAGGITERYDTLYVLCDEGPHEVDGTEENLVMLKSRKFGGKTFCSLVPVAFKDRYPSMGGSYAGCSDSRFRRMVERACGEYHVVLPVHDRIEG